MSKKRKQLILEFWDKGNLYFNNKKYYSYVKNLINEKLKEDRINEDISTLSLINKNKKIKACIIARQDGILAGIEEISTILNNLKLIIYKKDGDKVKADDIIMEFYGNARKIMHYERTLLNILQRMSGIATLTYNLRKKIKNNCFISGTRKTLFPLIDKKAIAIGRGLTHRLNLGDFILIKDNHLKVLNKNIKKALMLAVHSKKSNYIEIEVKNQKEAIEAAETISNLKSSKKFAIMFDNMKPAEIKNLINKINKNNNTLFEASGNINESNIEEYSKTGVDVLSLGLLTHSAKAFGISVKVE